MNIHEGECYDKASWMMIKFMGSRRGCIINDDTMQLYIYFNHLYTGNI